ncbi:MAG: phage tail tip lysozyme [Candidatus Methanomethylicaceae archaeon]
MWGIILCAALGTVPCMDKGVAITESLVTRGLRIEVAAGFAGNFFVESRCLPKSNGPSGIGLAQWCGSRRNQLLTYAKSRGRPWWDLDVQLDFVILELSDLPLTHRDKILNSPSVELAATYISIYYERPRKPNLRHRINAAKRIYSLMGEKYGIARR